MARPTVFGAPIEDGDAGNDGKEVVEVCASQKQTRDRGTRPGSTGTYARTAQPPCRHGREQPSTAAVTSPRQDSYEHEIQPQSDIAVFCQHLEIDAVCAVDAPHPFRLIVRVELLRKSRETAAGNGIVSGECPRVGPGIESGLRRVVDRVLPGEIHSVLPRVGGKRQRHHHAQYTRPAPATVAASTAAS